MKNNPDDMHGTPALSMHSIPLPVVTGRHGVILGFNDAAARSLGHPAESLTGKSLRDYVAAEDRARFCEILEHAETGAPSGLSMNVRFICGDGGIRPLAVSAGPCEVAPGKDGFVIVLTAPAPGKNTMAELLESEEHFRSLAESTPIAILLYQDDKWVYANAAAERITGYSGRELVKMNFWDFVHPDFVQIGKERGKKRQSGQQTVPSYEIKIITKPGEEKWVLINGTSTNFRGKTAGLINVIEITEIKRIQEELESANRKLKAINDELVASQRELERSEYRYRDIFDNFPVGIFQTGLDGEFITANNEMARILGYTAGADLADAGKNVKEYYAEADARKWLLEEVRTRGYVKGYETRFRRSSGELIWISINSSLRRSPEGGGEYLEGYIQDITAQKLAEEEKAQLEKQLIQAQKMEAIGRLAGGIAHDFNNLLTAIMGNAEIGLKTAGGEGGAAENINDILVTSRRAADLTRQLLAFSRRQVIKPVVIDVNSFLDNLDRMLRRIIGEDIVLNILKAPDLAMIKADPSQIEQLVVNLVVNARDAMPHGGVISIKSSNRPVTEAFTLKNETIMPGRYVRVDVADIGVGMDRETMENIFEPFYSTKGDLGTGLGLSTVYGIVRQNNGFITVQSEKGKGSTFSIFLPSSEESYPVEMPTAGATVAAPAASGETILIVEDEESVRKLLVRNLSDEGYRVLEAANGGEAMEIVSRENRPIHLVISDVVLPDILGPNLIGKLRALRPGFSVIFMSGYTEQSISDHEMLRNNACLVPKPFLPSELKKRIREVLSN